MHFLNILYSFLKSIFFDNDDEANFKSKNFKPRRWYTFFITILITVLGIKTMITSYGIVYKMTTLQEVIKQKDIDTAKLEKALIDCAKRP
jgi:hypothetical protein